MPKSQPSLPVFAYDADDTNAASSAPAAGNVDPAAAWLTGRGLQEAKENGLQHPPTPWETPALG